MSDIRAITVDIDGTLLTSSGKASERTVQALRCCAERNIIIYVATARPQRLVFRESEAPGDADFLMRGGVFYNGAVAVDHTTGLYAHWPIPGEVVSEVVSIIEAQDTGIQIALQFEERNHSFRLPIDDATLLLWGFERSELVPFAEARTMDCSKIVALGERAAMDAVCKDVVIRLEDRLRVFLSDNGGWMLVTSHEARKESALAYLLRGHGISPDEVIVFGDDTADIGMLKTFTHSVAMGNAAACVKGAATYVTATNDEDGIERALRLYFGLV